MGSNRTNFRVIGLFLLLISMLLFAGGCNNKNNVLSAKQLTDNTPLTVKVLDVGQGDAILIRGGGQVILIDTGDVPDRDKLVSFLKSEKITTIDKLIITHPHADHLGGFAALVGQFAIKQIIDSGQITTTALFRQYLTAAQKKQIAFTVASEGDQFDLGSGILLRVLAPGKPLLTGTDSDLNNNSIVLRLTFGKFSMLFAGDAEQVEETQILKKYSREMKSTVLKVGHHGSRTSSSLPFLAAVAPEAAVISVGLNNDYHHPHPSILKRYEKQKTTVFRTDLHGTVTIAINGENYTIMREKGENAK
ncbi:MAG: ComEC family competence protein [Firmicutes bacterium]|nr:ComEC family competence protein [Bacillota bacterium]